MSADTLRKVAALMRERAEAAAAELGEPATSPATWRGIGTGYREPIKEHIASWHPAVALAVADWLDAEARKQTPTTHLAVTFDGEPMFPIDPAALAVARAYLGESA